MSWSVEYTTEHASEIRFVGDETLEANAAMVAAVDAVKVILEKNALGDNTKRYSVKISGHSNPDNEPRSGWSNDFININVYQMEEE